MEGPPTLGEGEAPSHHEDVGEQHGGKDRPQKVGRLVVDGLKAAKIRPDRQSNRPTSIIPDGSGPLTMSALGGLTSSARLTILKGCVCCRLGLRERCGRV